jgi:FG-GAP repeat
MQNSGFLKSARAFAGGAFVFAAVAAAAFGQGLERSQISPAVGTSSMRFGQALQSDGDVLVVGAPYEDTQGTDAGAVFVYRRDAATGMWKFEQEIFPHDHEMNACFGGSVSVSGDVLVAGACFDDSKGPDAGAAYVFRYNAASHLWLEEQKIVASVGSSGDRFGASVFLSGDVMIVGATMADNLGGVDSGAAYVYRYQNPTVRWVEEDRLVDSAGAAGDSMGVAVVIDGDRAFVSAPLADPAMITDAGVVLTFTRTAGIWTQGATLHSSSAAAGDQFGMALSLSGDVLAIGAPLADVNGIGADAGAAFVFAWDGVAWSQQWMALPPSPLAGQHFGASVAIDGGVLVIGSPFDNVFGKVDAGSAWIARFGKPGWLLDQQFGASDANVGDQFGTAVTLTDKFLFAASPGKDTSSGTDWGALYSYPDASINLAITPSAPLPGTEVTFSAFYGDPGANGLITLEDVGGTPMFLPVLLFGFGADHALTFTATTPNVSYDLDFGLKAYRIDPFGKIVESDMVYLHL